MTWLKAVLLVTAHSSTLMAAGPSASLFGVNFRTGANDSVTSVPLQILILLTALTVAPTILMAASPFLRITIVLHFLRQALGTQTTPSNQVLAGLALFLTFVVTTPLVQQVRDRAWVPFEEGRMTQSEMLNEGVKPVKTFLARFARDKDIRLFLEIGKQKAPASVEDLDLRILVPAYILSELRAGFQIGAVLFLPFLVIDLVVASVTLAIGMVQLPPVMISAPFKILLFVLADGWNLTVGSLLKSFY